MNLQRKVNSMTVFFELHSFNLLKLSQYYLLCTAVSLQKRLLGSVINITQVTFHAFLIPCLEENQFILIEDTVDLR